MIRVFHDIKFTQNFLGEDNPKTINLELVAEVDTNDLEKAYELTNNIDIPWVENKGVKAKILTSKISYRSTSTGDLMEKDGKFFVVAECGFREVEGYDSLLGSTVRVFHDTNGTITDLPRLDQLVLAAEVQAVSLEKAVELTQCPGGNWRNRPEVNPLSSSCRDTEEGDILELDGEFFRYYNKKMLLLDKDYYGKLLN